MNDRHWRAVWAGWVIYFGVAEWAALKSKNPKAPLSYFLRQTLGIKHKSFHNRAGQAALGAGVVWIIQHLYERTTDEP